MSAMKKGMQYYKKVFTLLNMYASSMPDHNKTAEALLGREEVKRTLGTLIAGADLRASNAVATLASFGDTRSDIPSYVNGAIEKVFAERASKIIQTTTDVKRLQKLNKQLDKDAQKETGARNYYKAEINARIAALSK